MSTNSAIPKEARRSWNWIPKIDGSGGKRTNSTSVRNVAKLHTGLRGRRHGLLLFMPLGAWIAPPATQRPESRGNFLHRLLRGGIDSRALNGVHCPVLGFQGEMVRTSRRVGVVLFQLGGPDTLEAIEPFLYNLFCDPDIIDFPFARIVRTPLAKLISAAP